MKFSLSEWLDQQKNLLLPVSYFMVTFTLPEELRSVARSHQQMIYNILFRASSEALLELAQVDISENSVWRLTQHWGGTLQTVEAQEDERANETVESLAASRVVAKRRHFRPQCSTKPSPAKVAPGTPSHTWIGPLTLKPCPPIKSTWPCG